MFILNQAQAEFINELCKQGATFRATANACLDSPLFSEYHGSIMREGSYDGCHLKYAADDFFGYEKGTHDELSAEYWKKALDRP